MNPVLLENSLVAVIGLWSVAFLTYKWVPFMRSPILGGLSFIFNCLHLPKLAQKMHYQKDTASCASGCDTCKNGSCH